MFWVLIICVIKILSVFMTVKFSLDKEVMKGMHIYWLCLHAKICSVFVIMNDLFESCILAAILILKS